MARELHARWDANDQNVVYEDASVRVLKLEDVIAKSPHVLLASMKTSNDRDFIEVLQNYGTLMMYEEIQFENMRKHEREVADTLNMLKTYRQTIPMSKNDLQKYVKMQKGLIGKQNANIHNSVYIRNTFEDRNVQEHQLQNTNDLLPLGSPYTGFTFKTKDECKASRRNKSNEKYYMKKDDLVNLIKKKQRLRSRFSGLDKMSKDAICDKLFNIAQEN